MTDIHTHILPGIDDGSEDIDMSFALLEQEVSEGVNQLVFTPHFHPSHQDVDEFLKMRQRAVEHLKDTLSTEFPTIKWKLGAEIYYSTHLLQMFPADIAKLAIEGTPYILLEFSTQKQPLMIERLLQQWHNIGLIPIIAHVERYPYVRENPEILLDWIDAGAKIQANASSIIRKGKSAKFIKKAVDKNLIHFIASDTHDPDMRPANVSQGLQALNSFFSPKRAEKLIQNADNIFKGTMI